ncbi:MAG: molybdate ABC transporter substrate-binding protein [Firmicutes bacterium]|nr:molybdate ABC transporter substrate-binding protein [Bacillota bacterium]
MKRSLKYSKLSKIAFIFLAVALIGTAGCAGLSGGEEEEEDGQVLFAYVGANLKDPVSDLAEAYEDETGIKVELTFQNAGALLSQIETMKKGDIYIPGGTTFANKAQEKGHVEKIAGPIAYHTPVIIVPGDNPAGITSVLDLANVGVKLVIPDQESTTIGKTACKIFDNTGLRKEIEKNIITTLESPAKVLAVIGMGEGNAGLVEYSNAFNNDEGLKIVEIEPAFNEVDKIPIVSLTYSKNKALAEDFMEYVQQNGPTVFETYGFKTTEK